VLFLLSCWIPIHHAVALNAADGLKGGEAFLIATTVEAKLWLVSPTESPARQLRDALRAAQKTSTCANAASLLGPHPPGTAASPQSKLSSRDELMEQPKGQSSSRPSWGLRSQDPYSVVPGLPSSIHFPNCNIHIYLKPSSVAALLQGQGPSDLLHQTQALGLSLGSMPPYTWGRKVETLNTRSGSGAKRFPFPTW